MQSHIYVIFRYVLHLQTCMRERVGGGKETNFQKVPHGTVEQSKCEIQRYVGRITRHTHCFLGTALFLATAFRCPKGGGPPIRWGLSALLKGNWFKCHSQNSQLQSHTLLLTITATLNQSTQLGKQCLPRNSSVLNLLCRVTRETPLVTCSSASLSPFLSFSSLLRSPKAVGTFLLWSAVHFSYFHSGLAYPSPLFVLPLSAIVTASECSQPTVSLCWDTAGLHPQVLCVFLPSSSHRGFLCPEF